MKTTEKSRTYYSEAAQEQQALEPLDGLHTEAVQPRPGLEGALRRSLWPGAVAAAFTCTAVALLGRSDTGSAIAPINASSHVIWGDRAGQIEEVTLSQTLPGLAVNVGASFWWAFVFEELFGRKVERSGVAGTLAAGCATAAVAYVLDYRILPRRLSPGWEQRLSDRSLLASLGIMGIGLGVGALLGRRR